MRVNSYFKISCLTNFQKINKIIKKKIHNSLIDFLISKKSSHQHMLKDEICYCLGRRDFDLKWT